jgi:hypothetical protein
MTMTLDKIIEALQITTKYCDPAKSWLQGEHDIIFLPIMNDVELDPKDEARLLELGAHRSSEGDSWACFT